MKSQIFAVFLMLVTTDPSASDSSTHCGASEEVFFSCNLEGSAKTVSLCGESSEYGSPKWVQYRFGTLGDAELVFPAKRDGSLEKFGGVHQTAKAIGLNIMEVWFRVGVYDYMIEHISGGECEEQCEDSNDLVVFKRGKAVMKLECRAPVINNLWPLYGHISADQSRRP
ncbi:hypothetical protein [Pseudomarimonas arenosa]|uniref:Uncharacterized protein n=1 Tax=Pseudomarimonas arenosa TaxID=2774145 RepID=A0AAW3ZPB4_9GAMM|nr:hypothetical protein [Pseudomarimonas arenosa]MBD8528018.1 hypothetical protein [Pseudomarimonas arenosa]